MWVHCGILQDGGLRVRFGRQRSVVWIPGWHPNLPRRKVDQTAPFLGKWFKSRPLRKVQDLPSYHFDIFWWQISWQKYPEVFPPTNWHPKKIDATSGPWAFLLPNCTWAHEPLNSRLPRHCQGPEKYKEIPMVKYDPIKKMKIKNIYLMLIQFKDLFGIYNLRITQQKSFIFQSKHLFQPFQDSEHDSEAGVRVRIQWKLPWILVGFWVHDCWPKVLRKFEKTTKLRDKNVSSCLMSILVVLFESCLMCFFKHPTKNARDVFFRGEQWAIILHPSHLKDRKKAAMHCISSLRRRLCGLQIDILGWFFFAQPRQKEFYTLKD